MQVFFLKMASPDTSARESSSPIPHFPLCKHYGAYAGEFMGQICSDAKSLHFMF